MLHPPLTAPGIEQRRHELVDTELKIPHASVQGCKFDQCGAESNKCVTL